MPRRDECLVSSGKAGMSVFWLKLVPLCRIIDASVIDPANLDKAPMIIGGDGIAAINTLLSS